MVYAQPSFGSLLRDWRRRMSQLELATTAEISQRHLSFVESGRSRLSRDMVIRLSDHLSVPLRERNTLMIAAAFALIHQERALIDPAVPTVNPIHWHIQPNRVMFVLDEYFRADFTRLGQTVALEGGASG